MPPPACRRRHGTGAVAATTQAQRNAHGLGRPARMRAASEIRLLRPLHAIDAPFSAAMASTPAARHRRSNRRSDAVRQTAASKAIKFSVVRYSRTEEKPGQVERSEACPVPCGLHKGRAVTGARASARARRRTPARRRRVYWMAPSAASRASPTPSRASAPRGDASGVA